MLELKRKLFHLVAVSSLALPVYLFPFWLNFLLFSTAVVLNYLLVKRNPLLMKVLGILVKHLEREKNLDRPGIQSLYLLSGVFLSYILFGEDSVFGIITLAVGDALSGLVGYYLGRRKLFHNPRKTLEGSLAFFLSSFLVLNFLTYPLEAFLVALTGTIVESLPGKLDDNFTVPLSSSLVAYLV